MDRLVEVTRRYPVAPPVALFFFSLAVGALGEFGWGAARAVAVVLSMVAEVGIAVVCTALLWSPRSGDRTRLWTGLVGAPILCGLEVTGLPEPTSIGGGLVVLVSFVLLGFGALSERTPRG